MRPLSSKSSYEALPEEKQARNEAAVDLFGQHLMSLRNQLFDRVRQSVESDEACRLLPRLKRQEYEAVATLGPEFREAALELASKSADLNIQSLLVLLFSDITLVNYHGRWLNRHADHR